MKLENGSLKDTIVVANPGTGKTWEIVDTVIALLRENIPGDEILCVTFTNKAADEMRSRILQDLKDKPELRKEGMRISVSTIHSHAAKMLESGGKPVNLVSNTTLRYLIFKKFSELGTFTYQDEYLLSDITPRTENIIRYLKSFRITPDKVDIEKVKDIVKMNPVFLKNKSIDEKQFDRLINDFLQVFMFYEAFKSERKLMDYNDILSQFLELNNSRKYRYVLVDEFQDLNQIQTMIARELGRNRIFVGDRKQSIFGFQGGSLSSFNSYLQNTDFRKLSKSSNYRSTDNILNYAKSYFLSKSTDKSYEDELRDLRSHEGRQGEKVDLIIADIPERVSCNILKQSMDAHNGEARQYAIIARTNGQISKISAYLDDLGISYSSTMPYNASFNAASEIISFLRGLFSTDQFVVARALLTPFSGLTLMEATDLFRKVKATSDFHDLLPDNITKYRSMRVGSEMISTVLREVILPLSVTLGNDYYMAAKSISEASHEFFDIFREFSVEEYFNYLIFASSEEEIDLQKSNVNLLTVHKAKGLEFDEVIYVPASPSSPLGFFDIMASGIIKQVTGLDVIEDLSEEPLRIDFVAITRPKDKLSIVVREKLKDEFLMEPDICRELSLSADQGVHSGRKFDEAYALFISGRTEEARDLLEKSKKWLEKRIFDYFKSLNSISYSMLSSINEPLKFLQTNIMGLSLWTESSRFGTSFHELASGYSEGKIRVDQIPEGLMQDFNNFRGILNQIGEKYVVPAKYNEYDLSIPLSDLLAGTENFSNIAIKAKIDAVFVNETGNEFLVVDYKTSKKEESSYWHQVWLYTRVLQKYLGVSPDSIHCGIAYVSLRGGINVGKTSLFNMRVYNKIVREELIPKKIGILLGYIDKPESFIEEVLSSKPADEIQSRIYESLKDAYTE